MRKLNVIKTSFLTFIFSFISNVYVFAEEVDDLPQELGMERLSAIIKKFGPPPLALVISVILLLVLILSAVIYYKSLASKEGGKDNGK